MSFPAEHGVKRVPASMSALTLRWLAVIPAAALAYAFLQLLFIFLSVLLAVPPSWNRILTQVIATIVCPYYFVFIGSKVAPTARLFVAIGLTVILASFYGFVMVLGLTLHVTPNDPLWYVIASLLVGVASGVVAVLRIHNDVIK